MNDLLFTLSPLEHPLRFALAFATLVLAYGVFTLVGFGSGLIAGAPLALVMPVARVIPLLAVLDFAGSATRGWQHRQRVAWSAFRRLLPGMLAGQALGVLLLARLPLRATALTLGLFVVWQGLRGLRKRHEPAARPAGPALLHGLIGGIFGGLFGSGGFVYAAWLERSLPSREAFRATQAVIVALSTGWRIVLCAGLGLLDGALLLTALACVPAMLIGVKGGQRIDLRLSRERLFLLLNGLLVASGGGLLLRHLA
ncbi:MAG: sulfite exporter TauE/SafE family protein [Azonexaceae bacterium]|nr:sulfite exporter TauE/SafE family protein [Azonexaceae bacterium]